jgi:XTP/dITP diphosphohydrolase
MKPDSMKLVLASGNRGKLVEMRDILGDFGVELVAQGDLGIDDIEETGTTFVENALLKARHAARMSGLPALGDDSGLCVDALGGAPGLYSARYAGAHGDASANIAKLLDALRDIPDEQRGAHFHCTIVLLRSADDPAPLIAEGAGTAASCTHRAARTASATTRCSSMSSAAAAPPRSTPR